MGSVPLLPPGKWRSPDDAARWKMILKWNEEVGELYRQQLYLHMTNPKFAERIKNSAYKVRIEREHKKRCDEVEAAIRSHLRGNYIFEDGDWESELELVWVTSDDF